MNGTDIPEVEAPEARRRAESGSVLVDVRESDEYEAVRAPAARLVPLSTFLDRFETDVPNDREVLVICRSGVRSARATAFLRERGVDAKNVAGGMLSWEEEGLPVERGGEAH